MKLFKEYKFNVNLFTITIQVIVKDIGEVEINEVIPMTDVECSLFITELNGMDLTYNHKDLDYLLLNGMITFINTI